jgi:hypothetical protein
LREKPKEFIMTIQHADLIARYQHIRKLSRLINNELVSKFSKNAIDEGGKKLGILRDGILVFDTEDATSVLMDFCVYDVREKGMNAIERKLAEDPPAANSEEMRLLQQMGNAHFSLYIVEATEPGIGLHLCDLLSDDKIFIVDVNLSRSAPVGLVLASRIITIDGISMTTGASLPVAVIPQANRKEFVTRYAPRVKAISGGNESPAQASELAAMLLRTCLKNGAASHVRYAEAEEENGPEPMTMTERQREWSRPLSKSERAKLNKRCPCGSGRKFRNCCGTTSKK